jgi:hypothetical protein
VLLCEDRAASAGQEVVFECVLLATAVVIRTSEARFRLAPKRDDVVPREWSRPLTCGCRDNHRWTTRFDTSLPFHRRLLFDEMWMTVVAFLPVPTIVAAVKAISLGFCIADERSVWQPIVGWGAVPAASALNAFFYRVIADTLG